jgi:hypothetical protein
MEACAITVKVYNIEICILAIYRSPPGDYEFFLEKFEMILCKLSKLKVKKIVICVDFKINYRENNSKKIKMEDILTLYNLKSIVTFPTRVGPTSATIIDNIFIDEQQFNDYVVFPIANGLSDHEAQVLMVQCPISCPIKKKW